MTTYTFTGAFPRVLTGLSQGINASLTPEDGEAPVYGSTIEAQPGDVVETDAPYPHPELEEITAETAPAPDPAEVPEPAPDAVLAPAADPAPATPEPEEPADPAHTDMTAEGAPAPATA